jgi:REP element-mobilizing transposase RayT
MLDHAVGDRLVLNEARYARIVRDTLVRGQRELGLYMLRAWVIQHNHVHVLIRPNAGTVHIAETVMDASEDAAARRFWERESYERLIRDERECAEAVEFVEQHPVRLGLVDRAADWEWSSAHVPVSERTPEVERLRLPFTSPCERALARV